MSKDDKALEILFKFISIANEVIVDRGKAYNFECPVCGGNAMGIKAETNGHLHAICEGCGIKIMQ